MGLSGIKLLIIAAVVGILFLPMLLRQARAIPALLDQARSAFGGEDDPESSDQQVRPAPARQPAPPSSVAERLGRGIGRSLQRLRR